MGANIARRLLGGGHDVIGFDRDQTAAETVAAQGVRVVDSLETLVQSLDPARIIWLAVPAGEATTATLEAVGALLDEGDTLVDGGNTMYKDSMAHAASLRERGIDLLDVGTSGGIWGLENGYSLMIGGSAAVVERLRPIFETLAPAPDAGWGHVGPSGAGHFTKMIHNGIEYGAMQAYAEGFALMERKREFDLDLHQVAEIWRSGSVVRSWLLELISSLLSEDPSLARIAPHVEDSGEGRWTVAEAIELNLPAPVITLALLQRLGSREQHGFSHKLLAGLRNKFGGHSIRRSP
jgi:6-phosphogluconate dehydrogenase